MSTRMLLLTSAAGLAATALVAAGTVDLGAAGRAEQAPPKSTFSIEQARRVTGFAVYGAGSSVDGLPLVAVLRRADPPTDYVSFVYGDCRAASESGCAPPVEVQSWPACVRSLSRYERPFAPVRTETTVRGVPAALVGDGDWLEFQTGRTTVVVFAATPERMLRVADRLRGVNVQVETGRPLPRPAPGALDGSLPCG